MRPPQKENCPSRVAAASAERSAALALSAAARSAARRSCRSKKGEGRDMRLAGEAERARLSVCVPVCLPPSARRMPPALVAEMMLATPF